MTVNIDIHLKGDDSFEASIIKDDEERYFITLQKRNLTIYFEGEDFEGYKNACRTLDRMKNAIQEIWRERKGGSYGNERSSEA